MNDKKLLFLAGILTLFLIILADSIEVKPAVRKSKIEAKNEVRIEAVTREVVTAEPVFTPYEFIPLNDRLQTYIHAKCEEYGINYNLALAIIKTESNFNVNAVGDNGQATGLCQIWAKWHGQTAIERDLDINKPTDNVELMLVILTFNLERCDGDMTGALQMYNTGGSSGNEYANRVYNNLDWILTELGE